MTPRPEKNNPTQTSWALGAQDFLRAEPANNSRAAEGELRIAERIIGSALWGLIRLRSVSRNPALKKSPSESDLYFGRIISAFLQGCRLALRHGYNPRLIRELNAYEDTLRGFAFEGAAMGLSLSDFFIHWRRTRLEDLKQLSECHIYMIHVGVGWAFALCRIPVAQVLRFADPLLGWLIVDGCGFYYGFFHGKKCLDKQEVPRRFLLGYAARAFDQGLGRSLWFAHQANIDKIHKAISSFAVHRQSDLWSGIGLACSYAGGIDRASLERLLQVGREFRLELAQGAAFAAEARRRACTPARHTESACEVFCKMSSEEAAMITEVCRENVSGDGVEPAYEVWRRRIRVSFE